MHDSYADAVPSTATTQIVDKVFSSRTFRAVEPSYQPETA